MIEIYRDENLVAVQIPPQTRTLRFTAGLDRSYKTRRYDLPYMMAAVAPTKLFDSPGIIVRFSEEPIHFNSGKLFTPFFPGCTLRGVCMGNLPRIEDLDEAKDFLLEQFYARPFDGHPPQKIGLIRRTHSVKKALAQFAIGRNIDARPFSKHWYVRHAKEGEPLLDEMPDGPCLVAYPSSEYSYQDSGGRFLSDEFFVRHL